MSQEISWEEVAERSGYNAEELRRNELTSTTKRQRRVAEFDWELLRKAATLNAPTDIALSFVDYISKTNENARRFEKLTDETIRFIEEVRARRRCPRFIDFDTLPQKRQHHPDRRMW